MLATCWNLLSKYDNFIVFPLQILSTLVHFLQKNSYASCTGFNFFVSPCQSQETNVKGSIKEC